MSTAAIESKPLATYVRQRRADLGLSQADLSGATAGLVKTSYIALIETGRRTPTNGVLAGLAQGLKEPDATSLLQLRDLQALQDSVEKSSFEKPERERLKTVLTKASTAAALIAPFTVGVGPIPLTMIVQGLASMAPAEVRDRQVGRQRALLESVVKNLTRLRMEELEKVEGYIQGLLDNRR